MTSPHSDAVRRRIVRCLGGGALALAAACAPLEPPPQPALPRPQTVAVEYGHRVAFATDRAELFLYPGTEHLFTDSSLPAYDADATGQVLERALRLLAAV